MLLLTLQGAEDFTALPHILLTCNGSQAPVKPWISPKYRSYLRATVLKQSKTK